MPVLTKKGTAGEKVTLKNDKLEALKQALRGELIQPNDANYDEVRQVYNAMIDRHPSLIIRCTNVADVIHAVNFARNHQLFLAVRGGGHSAAGLGVCDGGLVIDLEPMKGIRVDPQARTVRVEAGCTWGEVDHATHAFGLATVSGIISTTGVSGLTLGGGHGYLSRKYGLTIDNLLSADLVLADGSFVTVSEEENADLFWAIRGGGGNFGIVTSFLFRLHPVYRVYAGPMFWPLDQAKDILQWYRDYLPSADRNLYGFFVFLNVPPSDHFPESLHHQTVCGVVWCYTGSPAHADDVFDPIRHEKPPIFEHLGAMPYPALQSTFDRFYPPGYQWYWKGDFVKEISDEAIAVHLKYGTNLPTPLSTMHLYPIDQAVHEVSQDETAFSYRDANWSMVIAGVDPDPNNSDRITQWTKEYWEALHPYSAGGGYVNFLMDEGQARVQATYRENYPRLVALKNKYDPDNLFCFNQNIKPNV